MLEVVYCNCIAKLDEQDDLPERVLEFIIFQYLQDETVEFSSLPEVGLVGFQTLVRYLELKGLVITTECSENLLQVKPVGFYCLDNIAWKVCRLCQNSKCYE